MNKWQITGQLHNEPQYFHDQDRDAQVMQFTLVNTTLRDQGTRKLTVWIVCTWLNPPKEEVMLFHKGEMAYVEGPGYHRVKRHQGACTEYWMAVEVDAGGWRPHPDKTGVPREKLA
jgi:single-stranded DNA-binding protein